MLLGAMYNNDIIVDRGNISSWLVFLLLSVMSNTHRGVRALSNNVFVREKCLVISCYIFQMGVQVIWHSSQ